MTTAEKLVIQGDNRGLGLSVLDTFGLGQILSECDESSQIAIVDDDPLGC